VEEASQSSLDQVSQSEPDFELGMFHSSVYYLLLLREGRDNLDTIMIVRIIAGALAAGIVFVLIHRRRKQAQSDLARGKRVPH
jgi:hypothetical protein